MKKTLSKILSVMLAVISVITMASVAQPARAYEREYKEYYTDEFGYDYGDDGCYMIVDYLLDNDVVKIPNEIKGIPVTGINSNAFKGKNLRKVIFPENMRTLWMNAFTDCKNLEEVVINDGLETVGQAAFKNCTSLTEIHLPESCKTVYMKSFEGCSQLQKIAFDSETFSFRGIIQNCFAAAKNAEITLRALPNIKFYSSLAQGGYYLDEADNGRYVFRNKQPQEDFTCGDFKYTLDNDNNAIISEYTGVADVMELDIPSSLDTHKVVGIGAQVFDNKNDKGKYSTVYKTDFDNLTPKYKFEKVTLPESVKYIGDFAFMGCRNLKSINLPDSVEKIGYAAFALCDSLESPKLPASIRIICSQTFAYCPFNGELSIPEGVSYIGAYAFERCKNITSVNLPKSLDYIGEGAFDSSNIESIRIPKELRIWNGIAVGCEKLTDVELDDGITSIAPDAFAECKALESVNLPKSVKKISDNVFYYCEALKNVSVAEGGMIESIGKRAFSNCKMLSNVDFSNDAELDIASFRYTAVTSYTFKAKQKYIPADCFDECTLLEKVTIEDGIVSIGGGAFQKTKLKNIVIPDSVINISSFVFYNCTELETATISKNVPTISTWAFAECGKLYKITWNRFNDKNIEYEAFKGCTSLIDFSFENVASVPDELLDDTLIKEVKLTLSNLDAQTVGESSFQYFAQLKTLAVGGNITEINSLAFASCENLETAVIADSVEKIADDAFEGCEKLTIYCNENSYAESYAKANGIRVTTLIVAPIANQSYTGKKIEPQVSVRFSDRKLTDNKDYSTEYINNLNVGTANVIVTGLGDFSMLITKVDFAIIAVSIDKAEIASIPTQTVNGQTPCEPKLKIKFNGKTLREGEDYTVSYKNNKSAGTATAIVKGIGNFKGTASVDFNIEVKQSFKDKLQVAFNAVKAVFVKAINWFLKLFK